MKNLNVFSKPIRCKNLIIIHFFTLQFSYETIISCYDEQKYKETNIVVKQISESHEYAYKYSSISLLISLSTNN